MTFSSFPLINETKRMEAESGAMNLAGACELQDYVGGACELYGNRRRSLYVSGRQEE